MKRINRAKIPLEDLSIMVFKEQEVTSFELIKMKLNRIALGLTAIVLMVLMVSTARACVGPGLSPGFWKHNVGVKLGLENGAYSDPGVTGPPTPVSKETMGTWLDMWSTAELTALYNDLNTKGGGAAGAAIRVAAANVFNAAADLFPY
jgi:hypothetical protein